jgi:hypothetical protein
MPSEDDSVEKVLQKTKAVTKEVKIDNSKNTKNTPINIQAGEVKRIKKSLTAIPTDKDTKKKDVVKRKCLQTSLPAIAALFPPYFIVNNLRNYKTDIIIGQLIKMMPQIGDRLIKGI